MLHLRCMRFLDFMGEERGESNFILKQLILILLSYIDNNCIIYNNLVIVFIMQVK